MERWAAGRVASAMPSGSRAIQQCPVSFRNDLFQSSFTLRRQRRKYLGVRQCQEPLVAKLEFFSGVLTTEQLT